MRGENIPDAILRYLAQHEGRTVAETARALRRGAGQVRDVVLELVSIDVLRREAGGGTWFVDPLLPVWLALERDRQAVPAAHADPKARAWALQVYQEHLQALQADPGLPDAPDARKRRLSAGVCYSDGSGR